jgi:endonuclease/exonuclease/phosphatase (EEP) superfamily protein YafD
MTGRRLWTVLGAVLLAVAAVAVAVRYVPIVNRPLIVTAALAPYLMLGAPLALLVFGTLKRWLAVALAAAVTAAAVAAQAPLYLSDDAPEGITVRFMSTNLRYGHADPQAVTALARAHADVVAVQELTPEEATRLSAAGLDAEFPFHALQPKEGPAGVGIWSRYPITASNPIDGFWLGLLTAAVRIPGVDADTTVVVTHMSAPWPEPIQGWRDDMARLSGALAAIAADADGPVLVAGDLNSTTDMREFRRLLHDGYRDAAEQAGAGVTRTHPADIVVPPVFAVDHILTRDATATSVRTFAVEGSDHRTLVAAVKLTPNS